MPESIYLTQFSDSESFLINTYEEDINVSTLSIPNGSQKGENLSIWREQAVLGKWDNEMDTKALFLGWDNEKEEKEANYTIILPKNEFFINENKILFFSMADTNENPDPESDEPADEENEPINLTIELIDAQGNSASLPLSHFSYLQPQIEIPIRKAAWMDTDPFSEIVFQSFEFALEDFVTSNKNFNPENLSSISFIFNRTNKGVVVLDNIGFR